MTRYFRLNSSCHLFEGENGGCIYDLTTGRMISINKDKYLLIRHCENNEPIDKIEHLDLEFIENLVKMNIGLFYDKPVFIEKFYIGLNSIMEKIVSPNYSINKFFIELDTECNLDCVFCQKGDNKLYRRTGCKRWNKMRMIQDVNQFKEVITQVSKLNCKEIVFIGGEPFLNPILLMQLVIFAKEQKIPNVTIFTNGTLLNREIITSLKKLNVKLKIQFLSEDDKTYNTMTNSLGFNQLLIDNLKLLVTEKLDTELIYLITKYNDINIQETVDFCKTRIGLNKIFIEYLYPIPKNNHFSNKYIHHMYNKKNNLQKILVDSFSFVSKYHNCFSSQLAMTCEGKIIPCIMARSLELGDIMSDKLVDILSNSNFEYYKTLTKDYIKGCNKCSFRYGCFDCRALEMAASGEINRMEYCKLIEVHNDKIL